jgi:hypothetical protein
MPDFRIAKELAYAHTNERLIIFGKPFICIDIISRLLRYSF